MTTTYEIIRNEICRESQIGDTAAIAQIDHPVAVEQNPDRDNFSLLHIAARKNRVAVIEALCNAGADVEAVSRSGVTPLWLACHWRNRDAVYKLVTAGANPYFEAKAGGVPLVKIRQQWGESAAREIEELYTSILVEPK